MRRGCRSERAAAHSGTIDYFWAAALPYVHPKCALALRLRWTGHTTPREQFLRIQLVDADGYTIARDFTQQLAFSPGNDEDIPQVHHVIVNYEGLRFASYGPYAIRVETNGQELTSLPFSIVPVARLPRRRAA